MASNYSRPELEPQGRGEPGVGFGALRWARAGHEDILFPGAGHRATLPSLRSGGWKCAMLGVASGTAARSEVRQRLRKTSIGGEARHCVTSGASCETCVA